MIETQNLKPNIEKKTQNIYRIGSMNYSKI